MLILFFTLLHLDLVCVCVCVHGGSDSVIIVVDKKIVRGCFSGELRCNVTFVTRLVKVVCLDPSMEPFFLTSRWVVAGHDLQQPSPPHTWDNQRSHSL